ncbi:MAG: hypothetical protein LBG78_02795, partial [Azoarcus sp.]|nr:hypothetical protein [Azoarcus sp.]
MKSRRTGIVLLLAGILAVAYLPSSTHAAPRESSSRQTATAQNKKIAELETAIEKHKKAEQNLQTSVRDLEIKQKAQLEQIQLLKKQLEETSQAVTGTNSSPSEPAEASAQKTSEINWILVAIAVFTTSLCVVFALRMRQTVDSAAPLTLFTKTDAPATEQPNEESPAEAPAPLTVTTVSPPASIPAPMSLPAWDT